MGEAHGGAFPPLPQWRASWRENRPILEESGSCGGKWLWPRRCGDDWTGRRGEGNWVVQPRVRLGMVGTWCSRHERNGSKRAESRYTGREGERRGEVGCRGDGAASDKWLELMDNSMAGIEPQLFGFKLHRTGIIYNSLDSVRVPFPSLVPPRHIH
jgi:hypothetical protein